MVRRIGHSPAALLVGFGLSFVLAPPALAINGTVKVSEFVKGSIQIWFEAEAFDERCPPPETPQDVPDIHDFYPVVEAEGAFDDGELPAGADGLAISPVNDVGGRLTYVFNIARAKGAVGGTWYFWGRVVDPGNRSEYMLVREDPGDPVIPSGPCDSTVFPGGNKAGFAGSSFDNQDDRVFERNTGAEGPPPVWGWSGGNRGHVKELRDGQNEMFLFHRESRPPVLWDVFLWTNDPGYVPTDQDYLDAKEAPPLPECPAAGDTHCGSATVEGPPGGGVGTYRVTVNGAVDDSGDPIIYSVSADDGVNPATTVSQTGDNVIELFLPPGSWTLTVTVDDDVLCDDAAPDNTCAIAPFEILPPEDEGDFKVSQHGAGVQIWIQAEKFRGRFDAGGPDLDPPIEPHAVFPVVAAKGAFGDPAANAVNRTRANGMLRYDFDISAAGGLGGTWTIWGRIINPSNASDYVLVDGDPDDPEIPFGPPFPGGNEDFPFTNDDDRIFEANTGSPGPPPVWGWSQANHEEGHTKEFRDGQNSMYFSPAGKRRGLLGRVHADGRPRLPPD